MNTPRAMLERLAFVCWLALTSVSVGLLGMSPWLGREGVGLFLAAAGGAILAWVLDDYGRRHLHFAECTAAFDFVEVPDIFNGGVPHLQRAENLRRLFDAWDDLAERRLRGEGDVWQVQSLRHEAEALLEADPQLRAEFEQELTRHPELAGR
jgi:hypothetical protein